MYEYELFSMGACGNIQSCMVMLVHVWSCHTWSCVLMKGISCLAMFGLVGSYKGMLGHVWSFMVM